MKITGAKLVLLSGAILTAFAVAFIYQRDLAQQESVPAFLQLMHLHQADDQLDLEVARAASFLVENYDQLMVDAHQLTDLMASLSLVAGEGGVFPQAELQDLALVLEKKLELIERIKFHLAKLKINLHYIPLLIDQIPADAPSRRVAATVLYAKLLNYDRFPGQTDVAKLEVEVASFRKGTQEPTAQQIGAKLAESLASQQEVDRLLDAYFLAPASMHFERLITAFQRDREQHQQAISRMRLLFFALTMLLGVMLWYVLRRLEHTRKQAEQSSMRLQGAVSSLPEGFALFDSAGQMVLSNATFMSFYPWLKGRPAKELSFDAIMQENRNHLTTVSISGEALSAPTPTDESVSMYIEHLADGRWLLASDNRTLDGGMVCIRSDITEAKKAEQDLRVLSRSMEQSPASILITDTEGVIQYVNPKFEETTGYGADEAIGKTPRIIKGGSMNPEQYAELWMTLKAGQDWKGMFHNKRKDGSLFWESASISPVRNEEGKISHFIAVKEDITERLKAEEELRMNAAIISTTNEGILVTDVQALIKMVNPAFCRITGYVPEEVLGRNPSMMSSGRHDKSFFTAMWQSLTRLGTWSGEVWNRRKDGSVFPLWLSITSINDDKGRPKEYVGVFTDITQRKQSEDQILFQANYDVLTGLPNRTLLTDRLIQTILAAKRDNGLFALLFIDLDRFKVVNDSFGHVYGDELLQMVASRLREHVRDQDTLARFGGDEFVLLLQEMHVAEEAVLVANKLIDSISTPFDLGGRQISIGASVGITLYPYDVEIGSSLTQAASVLLSNADMAMYQAKSLGRGRYRFFQSSMQDRIKEHMSLEQDLRQALTDGQLELHYQPITRDGVHGVVSAEALVRWRHPERGMISPAVFIPIAEETGLIGQLGDWVFRTACAQLSTWHQQGLEIGLSVNLSSRQRGTGFNAEKLGRIIHGAHFPARLLMLEITESLLLDESSESAIWINSFKQLGVQLAVDDFGTGYSSLAYLKRFPVDVLKIDKSFVQGLPDDAGDVSLVNAILAMAKSLGIRVIAEGVETEAQRDYLRLLGCEYFQGYFYSKPLPSDEFAQRYGAKR